MIVPSRFPDPLTADADGIVALSRTISCPLLLDAYYHGIFPWPYGEDCLIPWCAPHRRGVIFLDEFHIPKSFERELKKNFFHCRVDYDFSAVICACAAAPRKGQDGTWITSQVIASYTRLHQMGYAHSIEAYTPDGELAGGLYGISIGRIFCGESMFFRVSGASKFALVSLVQILKKLGAKLIDTQMVTPLTAAFGAREIPSAEYLELLKKLRGEPLEFSGK